MGKENKNWKVKALVGGLVVLGAVSSVYSYSKPLMASNNSVVVLDNNSKTVNSDVDKPLQVVKSEKTDEIEGLSKIKGLIGDNEAIIKIGINGKEAREMYKNINKDKGEEIKKFNQAISGESYKLNLSTLQKTPLNLEDGAMISPDQTKYAFGAKENGQNSYYIVDIKSNSKKKINMKGDILFANWAANSKYIVGITTGENPSIVVYDLEKDKMKEFKDDSKQIRPFSGFHSSNGKDIYFVANSKEKKKDKTIIKEGIYKLNADDGKITPIMVLPECEEEEFKSRICSEEFRVINEGEKVVLVGNLNGEDGLFIYDVKSKKANKVAQGASGLIPFWISPDENKIVYATCNGKDAKGTGNISVAKIKENELVDKILLLKDVDYDGILCQSQPVFWNNDSNKVIIAEFKSSNENNVFLERKGVIHSIYFK